ncbi:beta-glucosidase BglX [Psychrosphaera sp. F3M07]|uniref:beta-glucosidase BglX n=1 Tax=Psychrosphaera sp. F3M07 TaxID=2841560 RepID=UPI001C0A0093|nr:beta-glucosidase BglX [Psychrosphaera sp. F3M07]MBU2918845.1 beta-glucosidase BglX [Psychrosphaera sp. F3M07]
MNYQRWKKSLFSYCLMVFLPLNTSNALADSFSQQEKQIEIILNSLTLEEKAGQLNLIPIEGEPTAEHLQLIRDGKVGSVLKANGVANNLKLQKIAVEQSRSGIPILFQEDVIHGYKTIAPVPLAEAASWDLNAIEKSAAVAAREASAAGIQLTYAPMVDVSRDPRWGRIIEAAGEDPYLGSLVAAARVKGFQQGNDDPNLNILATVKHFAGYGAALAGRDYNIRDISERELREIHLPPFKAAIDAGVSSVMGAYTAYDGIPATAHRYLMDDILRQDLGFNGLLMTDWETIPNLVKSGNAEDTKQGVELAISATFDMDMTSQQYLEHLPNLVRQGKILEVKVDNAVRRVLRLKQQAGLLDNPYSRFNLDREQQELLSKQNWRDTKDITLKSLVLLKNENNILPIVDSVKHIAVIGPMAKAKKDLLGWWHAKGNENDVISIFDGLKAEFGDKVKLSYAQGVRFDKFNNAGTELISEAVALAKQADLVILAVGEQFWMSGEGGGTASLHLPGSQEDLASQLATTKTPIVTLVVTGRPYVLTDVVKHSDAVVQTWMPGTTGGEAIAEMLSGQFNPQGKLPVTFPVHQGQVPIFYNYKKTSHPFDPGPNDNRYTTSYRDISHLPLYPFGYGLSYSSFAYSDLELSTTKISESETLIVSVSVTNTSKLAGNEVVQMYLRDQVASVTRPIKELKGFTVLPLEPNETKTVHFELTSKDLAFIGPDLKQLIQPGKFTLMVGGNSVDTLNAEFELVK